MSPPRTYISDQICSFAQNFSNCFIRIEFFFCSHRIFQIVDHRFFSPKTTVFWVVVLSSAREGAMSSIPEICLPDPRFQNSKNILKNFIPPRLKEKHPFNELPEFRLQKHTLPVPYDPKNIIFEEISSRSPAFRDLTRLFENLQL